MATDEELLESVSLTIFCFQGHSLNLWVTEIESQSVQMIRFVYVSDPAHYQDPKA